MRAKGFLAEFGEGGEFRRGHSKQGCRWQKVLDTQSPFSKGAESWKVPGGSLPKGALKQIPKDQRRDPLISRFREPLHTGSSECSLPARAFGDWWSRTKLTAPQ